MPRRIPFLIACWAAAALAACGGDIKKGGATKACTKEYEQCTMPSGVLGVCNAVECTEGQPGPCLVCRSQH